MTSWCTNNIRVVARPGKLAAIKERCAGVDDNGEVAPFRFESIKPQPTSEGDQLKQEIDAATKGDPMRTALSQLYRMTKRDLPEHNITMPMDLHLWRLCNWGTKWDVHARTTEVLPGDDILWEVVVETAWSPPIAVVRALAELFPDAGVTLEYYAPESKSAGRMVWTDGGHGLVYEKHGHPSDFEHCSEVWAEREIIVEEDDVSNQD